MQTALFTEPLYDIVLLMLNIINYIIRYLFEIVIQCGSTTVTVIDLAFVQVLYFVRYKT